MSTQLAVKTCTHDRPLNFKATDSTKPAIQDLPREVSNSLIEGDAPLKAWRRHRGYSKIELSVAAEVKYTQIVGIENCESVGTDNALLRLANVLDVEAAQLR